MKKATKKKATRKKTAKKPSIDPESLEKVTLLLVTVRSKAAVRRACIDRLGMTATQADRAIREAGRKITLAADYHRDRELGTAIERLNECYKNSHALHDFKTCLASQKELNRLLQLYEPEPPTTDETTNTELVEIRGHLLPLDLAPPSTPTVDLVRIAVDRLLPHISHG
jgi:hypothetical protein